MAFNVSLASKHSGTWLEVCLSKVVNLDKGYLHFHSMDTRTLSSLARIGRSYVLVQVKDMSNNGKSINPNWSTRELKYKIVLYLHCSIHEIL